MLAVFAVLVIITILLTASFLIRIQKKNKLEKAIIHLKNEEYEEALKLFMELYTKDPGNKLYNWYMGLCHENMKNYELALVEYNKAAMSTVFKPPLNEASIHERIALINLQIGNVKNAEQEFKIVVNLNPLHSGAYYYLGIIARNNNQYQEALNYFRNAVKIKKDFTEAYLELGKINYFLNHYDSAKKALLEALSIVPSLSEAHFYHALVLEKERNLNGAVEQFQYALRDDRYKFDSYAHLGSIYMELSDRVKAFDCYEKALQVGTADVKKLAEVKYTYASYLVAAGEIKKALQQWREVNEIYPNYKDTVTKLEVYGEVSKSENLTRLLASSKQEYLDTGMKLCKILSINIDKYTFGKENFIEFVGSRRVGRGEVTCIVHFARWTNQVGELPIRELIERMNEEGATRGVFITTSGFSAKAQKQANIRPIELIGKDKLEAMLSVVYE
jgi:tetratricopeptide (TPR) repeat protein